MVGCTAGDTPLLVGLHAWVGRYIHRYKVTNHHNHPRLPNIVLLDWIGSHCIAFDWAGLDWLSLDWIGLDCIKLNWIGFDWIE